MRVALLGLLLLAAGGCSRCGEPELPPGPKAVRSACLGADDHVASVEEVAVKFAADDVVTVRLLRLHPRIEPGEPPDGVTRVEIAGRGCGQLTDVVSLSSICSGPTEADCLSKMASESLVPSPRFWAPKAFASTRLLVFFGDALDSDTPSVEIIQVSPGKARTVFYSEAGRTDKPFVYSRLEDLDGDGRPELLGLEAVPELDSCQPYVPQAIFSLLGEGEVARYVRNDALMEKWARAHGKKWHGAEPDQNIRECDDEGAEADAKGVQE